MMRNVSQFCFYWSLSYFYLLVTTPHCIHSFSITCHSTTSPLISKKQHKRVDKKYRPTTITTNTNTLSYHCDRSSTSSSSSLSSSSSSCLHASSSSSSFIENSPTPPPEDGMTNLHFRAKQTFASEPVVVLSQDYSLERFLIQESSQIQNLLLSGSGMNTPKRLCRKDFRALMEEWREQTRLVGAEPPHDVLESEEDDDDDEEEEDDNTCHDVVYQVQTGGINFAGLKVQSNALIGIKLVDGSGSTSRRSAKEEDYDKRDCLPEYQLVYIKDEQTVQGPKVLVWIFNKLTGKSGSRGNKSDNSGNNEDDGPPNSSKQQSVSSFSRFFIEMTEDKKEAVFTIESMLDIAIKFPTFLLKILPVSKEKAEEQGSASVMKTLVRDTGASLQRVVEYYKQVELVQKEMIEQ